jgi:outer membrane biosynthesis protein TonB
MDASKNIRHLKRLLQRRIAGHAGAKEERMLSKQAAEDPFLQDALEGLDAFPEGDHAARLERLQNRLQSRTQSRIIPLYIQRAAAAVLVLGLFGLGWWLLSNGEEQMAGPTAPQALVIQPAEYQPDAPAPIAENASSPVAQMPKSRPTPATTSPHQPAAPPMPNLPDDLAAADKPAAIAPTEAPGQTAATELADVAPESEQKKETSAAPKMQSDAAKSQLSRAATAAPASPAAGPVPAGFRIITGKITDDAGEPLIGASVLLQGTSTGTVTDIDGSYRLQIPEKEANARLVIAYTGYESKVVEAGEQQKLNVRLDASSASLSEVVVLGGTKKRKTDRSAAIRSFSMDVQPQGGWDALEQHIAKNRRMPVQAVANGISGEVLVEFSVTTKGKLRGFKVLEPLGFGCNEEAIRLLQTGPEWQNNTGKEQKASYSVRF